MTEAEAREDIGASCEGDIFHAQIIDASPAYIWLLNAEGRIVHRNSAAKRFQPNAPVPHTMAWRDAWPADCRFAIDRGVQEARAGRPFTFRTRFPDQRGAGVYLNTTVSAVRDQERRILRLLVKADDVTAEIESAAFLNTVIDVLPLALTVKDARTGRYILANRAAEDLFGKFEGLTGLRATDVLPAAFAEWEADTEAGLGLQSAVHKADDSRGVRYLSATKVATYDDDGVRHLVGLTHDITQKQRDADALRDALEQAEQANLARSAFISNISHEIRTPLNGVMAGAELLADRTDTPELGEVAAMIRTSAEALQHRFEQLLAMSRLDGPESAPRPEFVEIAPLVERLVQACRPAAEDKGFSVSAVVEPSVPAVLLVDPARLERAITPLLDNAVKFTDAGEIRLVVECLPEGRCRFTCIDTGVGFDAAAKDALFSPFHQQDDALTRRFGGMGLGLTLARENARALGGVIDASPREGGGAVFWLDIPISEPLADNPTDARLRALVVDDHPTNRRIVEMMLDGVADIVTAEDGIAALEATRRERFDIILMDIQMPRMDGITAVARIRDEERAANHPPVPIIMLTANTQPEHIAASRAAGAERHIGKPFTSTLLLSEIQALLSA